MKKIFFILIISLAFYNAGKCADSTSIYSYHFTANDGSIIDLGDYIGKKILFVNIATGSQYAGQLAELELLYQHYKDSLAVIAFPSNDFGNEASDDSTIQVTVTSQYGIHYILAAKTSVTGEGQNPVFKWLTTKSLNGVFENPVQGDFYKILVDNTGQVRGVFNEAVHGNDEKIQSAINY